MAQFQGLLTRVDAIVGDIEAGKGNIGKFLKDEELYTRLCERWQTKSRPAIMLRLLEAAIRYFETAEA